MAHVVMTLLGDIRYDGRVRKEIQTLTNASHEVDLVVSDFKKNGSAGADLGIPVHYIPMTLWPNPAMNFLSQLRYNHEAASIVRHLSPTHIHCHDLSTLPAGVWAKKNAGARLIFDAHELMPESMGGVREAVWTRVEKLCIDRCDHIIMPEKHRIAYFKKKYPQVGNVLLLENFPRRDEIPRHKEDVFRQIYPIRSDQKVVLYTGLIAAQRYVEELIDSMALCGDGFVLVMLGESFKGYGDAMRAKAAQLGLEKRVFFHDPVPQVDILRYMASADVGIALYRNTNLNNYYCASNKLFEYIALEKPVLTNNYPGLIERVDRLGQGVCLEEITSESLARAYHRASDVSAVCPGRKKYFWEDQERVLTGLYHGGVDSSPAGSRVSYVGLP